MGLFDKIREIQSKISEVERTIYGGKQEYLEIYERNLQLEKEIEQRTLELNMANKRMLTLQHIWEMMNSSKPLLSVLDKIVNSIKGELGYLHSVIIRKGHDEQGDYMTIVTQSQNRIIDFLNEKLTPPLHMQRIEYDAEGKFADSLVNKKIVQSNDLRGAMKYVIPGITDESLDMTLSKMSSKSIIIIPIYTRQKPFGWLVVLSSRDTLADSETDFLSIFAQQIEMSITIADLFEAVKEQAVTDGLTGLYNRRYFEEYVEKEVKRAQRQNQPFSIIGIDLDFLKKINDTYGHAYGDIAIRTVADVLKHNARTIDTAARLGGEEFSVILPGVDSKGAMVAAERIRKAIEDTELDTIGHITASIGVATFLEHSDNIDEIIELTDQAMYQSKRDGRNRVTLAKPASETSWQEVAVHAFIDVLSKHNIPVDKKLSDEICQKLKTSDSQTEPQREILYSIADMMTKIYNPLHTKGAIKSKVQVAVSLAKRFDLSKEEIDKLRVATLLYDIGNLVLPPEILQKAGPLTEEEKQHIKEHPVIAAREILKPISYIQDILPIIEHHHENWDGTGYPNKISKDEIPLSSQIILIVDSYFALLEQRAYRSKLSPQEALAEIKKDAGKKWNSTLVNEFVTLIENDLN